VTYTLTIEIDGKTEEVTFQAEQEPKPCPTH